MTEMRELVRNIRAIEQENGRPIAALLDLQGPKLRVGTFRGDFAALAAGAQFVLDADPAPGDEQRVYLPHPEILRALQPGHTLLLDDGKVRLTVIEAAPTACRRAFRSAANCPTRKGVSVPDTDFAGFSAMTAKDHADLEAALDAGADWIACPSCSAPRISPRPRRSRAAAPP